MTNLIYYFSPVFQGAKTKVRTKAEFVTVTAKIDHCRDPKDNFLLALAQDGKATHLLTGDKDLLVLEKIGKTKILTIAEYLTKR